MKSMTGFGRAKLEINNRIYLVEIKSVNHKYTDISIKLPRPLSHLEDEIKKKISSSISRGKVDVYVSYENYSDQGKKIIINQDLAKLYIEEFRTLAKENNLNDNMSVTEITKLPDVLSLKIEEDEDLIKNEVMQVLDSALDSFISMREQEGIKIREDLEERIEKIKENVDKISKCSTGLISEYVVKLNERIKELLKTNVVDESRLALETVIYADKCSVEEEITRLNSHISQFKSLIKEDGAIGKKIDFLIQEMNRETNTMGSKSASLEITNLVIDIKTMLEDIREQIQNIE